MTRNALTALFLSGGLLFTSAVLTGCASSGDHDSHASDKAHEPHAAGHRESAQVAVAALMAKSGSEVTGWVRFERVAGGLHVTARVAGLTPNAKHAIHIHEFGDCVSSDGKSAGGHYNPEGHDHAGPDAAQRHAGDLGNLQADGSGRADYNATITGLTIDGDDNPVIGRAIVIHVGEDDLKTQPTGNAGARIACGTIGYSR